VTNEEIEEGSEGLSSRSLIRIEVEGLFGVFNYRIETKRDPSNLLILYGDNGSGKTTLLESIHHLLSPVMNLGHRKYLSSVQFQRLAVYFTDGWQMSAERPSSGTGNFSLVCIDPRQPQPEIFRYDSNEKKLSEGKSSELASFLRRLNVEIYFLRADRTLQADSAAQARRERNLWLHGNQHVLAHPSLREVEDDESGSLTRAITKVNDYIRRRYSRAANIGGASANSIYNDVVNKIGDRSNASSDVGESSKEELRRRLEDLSRRSAEHARFRLSPPLDSRKILDSIREAPPGSLPLIASVLEPYLDSVTARLDALEPTQKLISSLVADVNSFFTNKKIRFSVQSGLQIFADNGTSLSPDVLSSGEKHLLLMFCHTVVAHGRRTIFIIDEPELSLNVKWQHKIVDKLLDIVKDSPTQFVFATHSIELLSQHLDNVSILTPQDDAIAVQ
jgi:predicted ATPase